MAGESVVEVLRGLRHIADSSVFQEYLVEEDGDVMEAAIRLLESVTAPTESERVAAFAELRALTADEVAPTEPFPEAPHVQAKYWAELVTARNRIAELEGELADMSALAKVNAMNVSDYSAAVEDAKQARAALAAVQQPNLEAVEALDRLTQIALDNTSVDSHWAVYEDTRRVRAEWQASRKVEAPLSEADRELVAEARVVAGCRGCSLHGPSVVHRLADAFERTSQPVQVEAAEKKIAQVERYLERFNPGGTRGQDVMAQAVSEILAGAEVAWAPSDDRTAIGQEQG